MTEKQFVVTIGYAKQVSKEDEAEKTITADQIYDAITKGLNTYGGGPDLTGISVEEKK